MTTSAAYDHDRTVTAFFDTRAAAEKAKADVVQAGVPTNLVTIVEGSSQATKSTAATQTHEGGFWGSVKELFAPEEDKHAYAEGLSRGGFLLTAHTTDAHYEHVLDILDHEGAVDMDEREAQWKSEGWSGYHATAPVAATSTAASLSTGAPVAARDTSVAGTAVGARGTGVGEETIQLAEESLRVGKRDVNHGRVRLRSYVVEKPVKESVSLHSEKIDVSRRPVDRALTAGDNLFQERTITAEEHEEEAVVSKEARVVEEVSLNKTAQDRTHEVNETVRRTEVEVDDGRSVAGGRATAGGQRSLVGGVGTAITEHMEVLASDGATVGTVDHLDTDDRIKLTKGDSVDGRHHFIPLAWVDHVAAHVHLNKTSADVRTGWTTA